MQLNANLPFTLKNWRRGGDSNPRWAFDPHAISNRARSATPSPLLKFSAGFFNHLRLKLKFTCQRVDSNHRPKAYESSALPLSYSGKFKDCQFTLRPFQVKFYFPVFLFFCAPFVAPRRGFCNDAGRMFMPPFAS